MVCYDQNLQKHKYLNGDEFPITFKVNYISEDLLPVTVTSRCGGAASCLGVCYELFIPNFIHLLHPSNTNSRNNETFNKSYMVTLIGLCYTTKSRN